MTKRYRTAALFLTTLLLLSGFLSGCGFQPLYADKSQALERNASILIMPIAESNRDYRASQHLHNALRDRLNPNGMPIDPFYKLQISLSQTVGSIAGDVTDETRRKFIEVRTVSTLINARNGRTLYTTNAIARLHFDVFTKNYDSNPAYVAAQTSALNQIADDINRAISLRLAKI